MKPIGVDRTLGRLPPPARGRMSSALQRIRTLALTWPFMASVALLLLNDLWLKQAWPGVVSGKLSDFAGVAVLTMLLLACTPRHRRVIFLFMTVAFIWWKSPLSQTYIDAMNAWLPVARIVDYTDLLALAVMPCCVWVTERPEGFSIKGSTLRRLMLIPVLSATAFGLMATTLARQTDQYQFRLSAASPAAELDRAQVVSAIKRVTKAYALKCVDCEDPTATATYSGDATWVVYTFPDSRTVSFKVEAHADGLILGENPQEKCAEILRDLKKLMRKIDPGLEFEELSRHPGPPRVPADPD